jgi:hypothetical protein
MQCECLDKHDATHFSYVGSHSPLLRRQACQRGQPQTFVSQNVQSLVGDKADPDQTPDWQLREAPGGVARQQRRVGLGRASLCVRALGQNAAYLAQLA